MCFSGLLDCDLRLCVADLAGRVALAIRVAHAILVGLVVHADHVIRADQVDLANRAVPAVPVDLVDHVDSVHHHLNVSRVALVDPVGRAVLVDLAVPADLAHQMGRPNAVLHAPDLFHCHHL